MTPTRLLLVCAAAPAGTGFPQPAQAAAPRALARAAGLAAQLPLRARCLVAPSLAARQTAAALRLRPVEEPALADCDFGDWAGRDLAEVGSRDPAALALWLAEATAAPHGGESRAAVRRRVADWLARLAGTGGTTVAVSHPAPIRAAVLTALGAPAACEAGLDIAALSILHLSHDGRRWRWRAGGRGFAGTGAGRTARGD